MSYEFAKIYDELMAEADYNSWYKFLNGIIKQYAVKSPDILELGCGTGEFLLRLKKDRYKVMGIDISTEMLTIAREKVLDEGLEIQLMEQDMKEFILPFAFDFIFSFFDTINYLLSNEELENTFERVSAHLDGGSYFLFDVVGRDFMDETFMDGFLVEDRENLTRIWQHDYIEDENIDTVHTVFFIKEKDGRYKRIEDYYEKMIFKETEIKRAGKKAGLKFIKVFKKEDLAGKRSFYLFEKTKDVENLDEK